MKFLFSLIFVFTINSIQNNIYSQNLRSGEMTYTWIGLNAGDLHLLLNVTIYADLSIQPQKFLHIHWGDGTEDSILFSNPILLSNINRYFFNLDHTYLGNGSFNIHIDEPNYIGNINNIPNSTSEIFRLETKLIISALSLNNNCPQFIYPQQFQWVDTNTIFDFSAFDPDPNDSLSYELTPCLVSNYITPNCQVDSFSGLIRFYPDSSGMYAIAIKIKEWRNNSLIGFTMRQMLIEVPSVAGINYNDFTSRISIFPSPTDDILNIESERLPIERATISDLTGKIIRSEIFSETKSFIDVSALSPGLYFLNLKTENGFFTKKFIK